MITNHSHGVASIPEGNYTYTYNAVSNAKSSYMITTI